MLPLPRTPSRRGVLGAAAGLGAVGVLGVPRPALAGGGRRVAAAPPVRLDGVARVNGLFGSDAALLAVAARDDDAPALFVRTADGGWRPAPVPTEAAELADGVVLPDGDVLLVGAVTRTAVVDLSSSDSSPADAAADESYVFAVSTLMPAAWRGRDVGPDRGVWRRLALGTSREAGRLTGVATADGTTVAVGHRLGRDGETPLSSFALATRDGHRWRSAVLPTGPLVEGAVVDVEHVDGRWLAVGFDLDGSVALASDDGLSWATVPVPADSADAQVQEVSARDDGSAVALTAPASATGDGSSAVVETGDGSAAAPAPAAPVFSVQVLQRGTAAVASAASDGAVVVEEVDLVGD